MLNIAQVAFSEPALTRISHRVKPKLCLVSVLDNVNMWRFIGYIGLLEKELIAAHTKDDRHKEDSEWRRIKAL